MKKHLLTLLLAVTLVSFVNAQDSTPSKQFMQIAAVEMIYSTPSNSVLIITNPDGTQTVEELDNIINGLGVVKLKSIKANESKIAQVLKRYTDKGWKLEQTIPYTISPEKDTNGFLMTRYMLSK